MPADLQKRRQLEQAILDWANGSFSARQLSNLARSLGQLGTDPIAFRDPVADRVAATLGKRVYPVDEGFNYTRSHYLRAKACLAYLRSDLQPVEFHYELTIIPARRLCYGVVILLTLTALPFAFHFFGLLGLLLWPLASIPGWFCAFLDNRCDNRDHIAIYPFDYPSDFRDLATLADRSPSMPPYRSARTISLLCSYLPVWLFFIVPFVLFFMFIFILRSVQGPFYLGHYLTRRNRIPVIVNPPLQPPGYER